MGRESNEVSSCFTVKRIEYTLFSLFAKENNHRTKRDALNEPADILQSTTQYADCFKSTAQGSNKQVISYPLHTPRLVLLLSEICTWALPCGNPWSHTYSATHCTRSPEPCSRPFCAITWCSYLKSHKYSVSMPHLFCFTKFIQPNFFHCDLSSQWNLFILTSSSLPKVWGRKVKLLKPLGSCCVLTRAVGPHLQKWRVLQLSLKFE